MRRSISLAVTALAGALTASLVGVAGPADAATVSHFTKAQRDWKKGATVVAAEENQYWIAARHQLASYGTRYAHERADLTALINIPLTDATPQEQATAVQVTRELNGFFHTPDLYGVDDGNPWMIARADWIMSATVSAATKNTWLAGASDELAAYRKSYATQRAELRELESIPLTNTTAKQRRTARRDTHALNVFFHTPHQKG